MILASNSPRREDILREIGFNLKILPSNIEEKSEKKNLEEKIKYIAFQKAISIASKNKQDFVLAADTIVELDGKVLGKPQTKEEVYEYLKLLSGRIHKVITAYSFINISKKLFIKKTVISEVEFYLLSDEEINWYIDTGEPFDKAGGYGIQSKGRIFVKK